ncbi:hypothetical protein [Candidatus Babela massiliensis]|uniref:Uncharacterized protein n=1 Tax=Candidatus Babela massiliensis TaxID=673862 RepID=V6DJY0_9BACT|nr:hypothetical protein [Candidatus Babela massiliensis]CDK30821.1 hypothetical protein BABL1_gene_194 [Candidatus Babela massiliensis]
MKKNIAKILPIIILINTYSQSMSLFEALAKSKSRRTEQSDLEQGQQAADMEQQEMTSSMKSALGLFHLARRIVDPVSIKGKEIDNEEETIDVELSSDSEKVTINQKTYSSSFTVSKEPQKSESKSKSRYEILADEIQCSWIKEEMPEGLSQICQDVLKIKLCIDGILYDSEISDVSKEEAIRLNSFLDKIYQSIKSKSQSIEEWNFQRDIIMSGINNIIQVEKESKFELKSDSKTESLQTEKPEFELISSVSSIITKKIAKLNKRFDEIDAHYRKSLQEDRQKRAIELDKIYNKDSISNELRSTVIKLTNQGFDFIDQSSSSRQKRYKSYAERDYKEACYSKLRLIIDIKNQPIPLNPRDIKEDLKTSSENINKAENSSIDPEAEMESEPTVNISKRSQKRRRQRERKKNQKAETKVEEESTSTPSMPSKQDDKTTEPAHKETSGKLADDIVDGDSCWKLNPTDPSPVVLNKSDFQNEDRPLLIRKRQFYRPDIVKDKQSLIVFIVIHGTWQKDAIEFHKDIDQNVKDLSGLIYNNIKKFAAFYATAKKKNLELLSFKWKGALGDGSRTDAGAFLKNLILQTSTYKTAELVLLGHSHGCNVINDFTNRIERPIALLIYFGCPRREEIKYQPTNYKALLYFISDSDYFTIAGRGHVKAALSVAGPIAFGTVSGGFLGYHVGSTIEDSTRGRIGGSIVGSVAGGVMAIPPSAMIFRMAMEGTNHFPEKNEVITAGFRVKLDSWNSNHGDLMKVVKYLPNILEKIMKNYRRHYMHSGNFHLNIDTEGKSGDPITLVIAEKEDKKIIDYPEITDVISLQTDEENYQYGWGPKQEKLESDYSQSETKAYSEKYKGLDITKNYPLEMSIFK